MQYSQESIFLSTLLQQIRRGMLLPAVFRRSYVWSKADVISFMESLAKGYPGGCVTVWTASSPAAVKAVTRPRIGPVQADGTGELLSALLDGQNRIATLAWASRVPGTPLPDDLTDQEKTVWADGTTLVVDLKTREFKFVPDAEAVAPQGAVFPMYAVASYTRANQFARVWWAALEGTLPVSVRNDALNSLDELQEVLMNARVGLTVLRQETVAEARDVFLRACTAGVPLTAEDLDVLSNWTPSGQ